MATIGTIFAVDDEPAIRSLVERFLGSHGYAVVTATDEREVVALVPKVSPDLLLVDGTLAGLDDFALCRRIREGEATRQLPIMVMTASGESEDIWLGRGVDAVVRKPFNRSEVLAWVRCLVAIKRAREDFEQVEATLISVVAAIEARSLHREGHIRRVAELSVQIASTLGVGEDVNAIIQKAALLHDVGNIWVTETILRKPGPLTREDFEQVKRHTVRGAALCSSLPRGEEISIIVRGHHERWDGQGYPDGLAGAAIPLGARIIAVADAFDTLTTDRSYRPPLSTAEALDVLWFGAGSQWDPYLVELLERILPEGEAKEDDARRLQPQRPWVQLLEGDYPDHLGRGAERRRRG